MKLASAYIRYSSNKQEGNNSVEVQRSEIMNAASRNEHHLPNQLIFIDRKTSAYHKKAGERSALNELKAAVKANEEIEYIYFYDYSRLDRTVYSFVEDFYYDLKQFRPNIQIYLCTTGSVFDPEDPRTKLEFILASYESAKKARAITDTQISLIENLQRPGARAPYGYDMHNKKLYPNEEAPIVVWIYFLYAWGFSMNKIAQILNTDHIKPPNGTKWRTSTVEQILSNDIYTGRLTWHFESRVSRQYALEDVHEPIVPPFLHKVIELNKKLKSKLERFDTPFLLTNLVNCSRCRSPLTTRNSSTKRNGKTYRYRHYQCHVCKYTIQSDDIHEHIVNDLKKHLQNQMDKMGQHTLSYIHQFEMTIQETLLHKRNDLQQIQANLEYMQEQPEKIPDDVEQIIQSAMISLNKDIHLLEEDIKNIHCLRDEDHLNLFFSQFTRMNLSTLTDSELRFVIALFIDCIYVTHSGSYTIHFKNQPFDLD